MVDKNQPTEILQIGLQQDLLIDNEDFKKGVAIPYFKDLYRDLNAHSDCKSKGIDVTSFLTYAKLPGIFGERFFSVMDLKDSGYVDLKNFVHGMFKVYYSETDAKIKLIFDIYDFDRDDYITKEDVKLVLSHIPTDNSIQGTMPSEGLFTQGGGGGQVFMDKMQTQEELYKYTDEIFSKKEKLDLEDFSAVITNISSELYLSVMIVLQTYMPCSENINRYKLRYHKYCLQESVDSKKAKKSIDQIRLIASPKFMSKLSPISRMQLFDGQQMPGSTYSMKVATENLRKQSFEMQESSGGTTPNTPNTPSSPTLKAYDLKTDGEQIQKQGHMLRVNKNDKLKKYWYSLLGIQLYTYKHQKDDKHKSVNSIVGSFINDMEAQTIEGTTYYPFKLIFPGEKTREFFLTDQKEKEDWCKIIKKLIGYSDIKDFYNLHGALGKGHFSTVKAATHIKSGRKCAVKVTEKKELDKQLMSLFRREIEVLKMCQHPHIIRMIDIFEDQTFIFIVMETCEGGDLFNYLEKRSFCLTEDRARELSHQIATSLFFLHTYGIAHRDLKPENILMSDDSDTASIKLVDFGLSKFLGPTQKSVEPFGTMSYAAPEILSQKPYSIEVDIWALGVLSYLMVAGYLPFDDKSEKEVARQTIEEHPDFETEPWPDVTKSALSICEKMLCKNQTKRPTIEQVLDHPWFEKYRALNKRIGKESVGQFKAYSLTEPESPKLQQEIKDVKSMLEVKK